MNTKGLFNFLALVMAIAIAIIACQSLQLPSKPLVSTQSPSNLVVGEVSRGCELCYTVASRSVSKCVGVALLLSETLRERLRSGTARRRHRQ
ncbi:MULTISPECIES: hypothetical protein [unclassified Nostoc]|uniref:hypothetical protein n=1 Tax=unclassified Nostoc TaxID=2593658 RepID=UPI002AD261C2|nr:hypothetical protein [Nostoc sp. DedQUE03]MDZ7973595.1 hypothetical protein [Nostoc sp. DedQUE03]MDZ8049666.1 hypothetical protein [Nostoc sp. DedQUE02]